MHGIASNLTFYPTIPTFNTSGKESIWLHCWIRRKCWKSAFSPFPTMFSTSPPPFQFLIQIYIVICKCFEFGVVYKILSFGKELTSLPNDKILDWSKFKAFVDNKINLNHKLKLDTGRAESIVGKGKNVGYQHFLLFPQCFHRVVKSQDCVVKG